MIGECRWGSRAMGMKLIAVILAIAAAIGAGVYYLWTSPLSSPPPPPGPVHLETPATIPPAPTGPLYPVPAPTPAPNPLPTLGESDATFLSLLSGLIGPESVSKSFWPEDTIRRIVVTVDNLPRRTFAARLNPLRPPGGLFSTTGHDDTLAPASDNAARYAPYVQTLERIDAARLVALYLRLYPLFQQAYVELGYPGKYFNDRLVEVIDVLLATPEVHEPPKLSVPHVLYEFADPELESRPAGQKLLIRMGADNASRVKKKLREIRRELTARTSPPR
jgi:Protein of unknown function (DUF3014)